MSIAKRNVQFSVFRNIHDVNSSLCAWEPVGWGVRVVVKPPEAVHLNWREMPSGPHWLDFFEKECLSKHLHTEALVSIKKGKSRRKQVLSRWLREKTTRAVILGSARPCKQCLTRATLPTRVREKSLEPLFQLSFLWLAFWGFLRWQWSHDYRV